MTIRPTAKMRASCPSRPDGAPWAGKPADDRGEDQQRHAVADAPLGDQLAHPHEQGGAGGEGEHDEQHADTA